MRFFNLVFFLLCGFCLGQPAQEGKKLIIEVQGEHIAKADGRQIMEGYVRFQLPGEFLLTAERCEYDPEANAMRATGNVKLDYYTDSGLVEISAAEIFYDIGNRSGYMEIVSVQFGDSYFFTGEKVEILEAGDRFIITKGTLTACNQPTPQWSIEIKSAKVVREGYAFIKGAGFKIKGATMLHIPYLVLPAMTERKTGILPPETGTSDRNGTFYSLPFYWAPARWWDATITPSYYDRAGLRLDTEIRYIPKIQTFGFLNGSYYRDEVLADLPMEERPSEDGRPLPDDRWRLKWHHDQYLFGGRFEVRVEAGSDFSVDRNYLQDTQKTRLRDYYYRARFDRDFGKDHLSISVDKLERILTNGTEVVELSALPDIRWYQPNRPIGGGFYFRNQAYLAMYDLEDIGPTSLDTKALRIGLDSEISRAHNFGRYFHSRWGLTLRGTHYEIEEDEDDNPEETPSTVNNGGASAFFEAVGPRVSRNYRFLGKRLVHYGDIGFNLRYGEYERDAFLESVFLDELDIRTNESLEGINGSWIVSSRLFHGDAGSVRPLLEMEIRQDVDLENSDAANRPIEARFRLLNLRGFHGNGLFQYNPDDGKLENVTVYGSVNRGSWRGYGGYVKQNNETGKTESFIGISELKIPSRRSRFKIAVDYDIEAGELKSQEFSYGYDGQCLGMTLNYVRSPFDEFIGQDRDFFQITLHFKNLGDWGSKF